MSLGPQGARSRDMAARGHRITGWLELFTAPLRQTASQETALDELIEWAKRRLTQAASSPVDAWA